MTWKVRGRSSSQTPEPASTPMPSARMSSIRRLPRAPAPARRRGRPAPARPARAAHRLVGERDQHQHGGADHQREDAEVEQQRAGQRHLADQRQLGIGEVGGEEGMAERPGAGAGAGREQQADADPAQRADPQAVLDPAGAAGHVLQDEGDRHRQPGREAAARQVVAAQQQVDRDDADDREQQLHDDGRDQQPVGDRVAVRRGPAAPRRRRSGRAAARAARRCRAPGGSGAAARRRSAPRRRAPRSRPACRSRGSPPG